MKVILSLFLMLQVFAGVGDSAGGSGNNITAKEIQRILDQNRVDIEIPEYKFDNNMSFRLHRFCNEGNQLRSLKKVPVLEEEWSYVEDSMVYKKVGTEYARRDFEKKNTRTIKIENEILIRKKVHMMGRNDTFIRKGRVLKKKVYTVPNCEEID